VLKLCRDLDLLEEPLGAKHGGEFGTQDLHRDLAVVLEVLGEVDGGHAAGPELVLDGVAVGEGGFETVEELRHCTRALGAGITLVGR